MRRVHKLRAACDAILVGVGTVLADDPHLTVKEIYAHGNQPIRVVLDSNGRTPKDARVRDGEAETLVYETGKPDSPDPRDLPAVLADLWARGVRTVMVEGGAEVLASFVEVGVWDHFTLYQAPILQGPGVALWPASARQLKGTAEPYGRGVLWRFTP
jgi:riboflavin-specific deaminase-like protein